MKPTKYNTLIGSPTTPADVGRWAQELTRLHGRIAPRFRRSEPRQRVLRYLQGIVSEIPRKNGWQLAEYAGEARPDGMQRLLTGSVWDVEGVRDDLRAYVLAHLGTVGVILVLDETSFLKRGTKSAGVGLQYCGSTGQVENCQVGVFLSYVTTKGHTLIDRELYLPFEWIADQQRRRAAGIPETVPFQTKLELARRMLERIFAARIPVEWVVADSVYGSNLDLRVFLEAKAQAYVLGVACDEAVGILTRQGRRRMHAEQVENWQGGQPTWQRLSMSQGTKGPRLFDWALFPILYHWQQDSRHFLLVRRELSEPHEKRYYLVYAPAFSTLQQIVSAAGARWDIETDFENGKDLGLDQYEVRSYPGWYRHITLVMLAQAYLTGICARCLDASSGLPSSPCPFPPALLALSLPEVRHLLARLIWPAPCQLTRLLGWSRFRRCHQSWARYYHTQRRLHRQLQC